MGYLSIPVSRPKLPGLNQISHLVKEMDLNQIYTNQGPLLNRAQTEMSKFLCVQRENLVFCSNATQGLIASASVSSVQGYLVPDYSFIATPLAVLKSGKQLELCDVDKDFRIDLNKQPDHDFFGLLDVLPFGDNNLKLSDYARFEDVIIDGAASLPNLINQLSTLPQNITIVFSLHATKVLGIGEGGLIFSNNLTKIQKIRNFINFGFNESRNIEVLGTNSKLSEISACYILAVIDNWKVEKIEWLEVNQLIFERQSRLQISDLTLKSRGINPYWIIDSGSTENSKSIILDLKRNKIGYKKWWQSFHAIEQFKPYVNNSGYENSIGFFNKHLGLPKFRGMGDYEIEYIFRILNNYF
jgi:dTDP-4-amino-4,6-dideoxygalactose transaminase